MDFEQRLQEAIDRGRRRSEERDEAAKQAALSEEELKRLHTQYRLAVSERIEQCVKRLPDHFPGFQIEITYGDRGWGAACFREDLKFSRGARSAEYSRLEIAVRPYSSYHVLDLAAKGTVRNKEVYTRNYFEKLEEADLEAFLRLVDVWILEYAEQYAAK